MTAGEAFLKAKCDYYNTSRQIEEDEIILGTVLMFNLYGNPKLRTCPDTDALSDIQFDDGSKYIRMPFRKMKRTTVMKNVNQNNGAKSLLDEVRGLVDNNLRQIHEAISITTTNSMVPYTHKSVRASMSVAVCLMPYRQNEKQIVKCK